jgi:hypothetical protein
VESFAIPNIFCTRYACELAKYSDSCSSSWVGFNETANTI